VEDYMDSEKRQRLQAAGWTVGNASDFLNLTPAEAELIELKVKLALLVKQQRKRQNLSQNALAKKMSSSQSRVAKIESGDPSVSLDLIVRALLTSGATRQELAEAIINSDSNSNLELITH
jgi:ribosome-binding protein aMBF1 (putative translation factor)